MGGKVNIGLIHTVYSIQALQTTTPLKAESTDSLPVQTENVAEAKEKGLNIDIYV